MIGAGVAVAASLRLSHVPELVAEEGVEPTVISISGLEERERVYVEAVTTGEELFNEVTPDGWQPHHEIGFETEYRGEVIVWTRKLGLYPTELRAHVTDDPVRLLRFMSMKDPLVGPCR